VIDRKQGKTYLTLMSARTKLSAKGQVVIPKDVRDALGLKPGQALDVTQTGGGVLLRPVADKPQRTFEEVMIRIRARINHDGPRASLEDMKQAVSDMFASGGPRWDK
jgi:AbrB family looped-hinge helix DNA binding protein